MSMKTGDDDSLKTIDRKVIPKPKPYSGDIKRFPDYQDDLKDYLRAIDPRWKRLLEVIEGKSNPIELKDHDNIGSEAGLISSAVKENFKTQMFVYLKAFTEGTPYKSVSAGGEDMVYEAYRQMCEQGRSRRPEHVLELRNRVHNPTQARSLAAVASSITMWEAEMLYLKRIKPEDTEMGAEDKKLILINLCPEQLKQHLKRDVTKWPKYHDILVEIHDYIARTAPNATAAHAKSLTPSSLQAIIDNEVVDAEHEITEAQLAAIPEEAIETVMALVRNTKLKTKGKGKGKSHHGGDGKASAPPSDVGTQSGDAGVRRGRGPPSAENPCHICGGADHFAKECPDKGKGN
jgi:hypothetical protein